VEHMSVEMRDKGQIDGVLKVFENRGQCEPENVSGYKECLNQGTYIVVPSSSAWPSEGLVWCKNAMWHYWNQAVLAMCNSPYILHILRKRGDKKLTW
jgi:hypothetical protein